MTHGGATKQGRVPEGSHDESIDLSAGFVLKTRRVRRAGVSGIDSRFVHGPARE